MNLREYPKVELHRHLELSVRHSTIKELAPQFGFDLKTNKDFEEQFLITQPMKDLGTVLSKFLDTQKLWATTEIIERLTYECCEDAFNEGIRILELRYSPTFILDGHGDLTFESIHEAINTGIQRAMKDMPMAVGLLCVIQRILPKTAENVTDFAIANKDTFIGLDLADNEVGFDSKPFAPFFERARKAGLRITVHSGEADVPKAPRYVKDAIDYLGAERIGHGLQIHKDPKMIQYVIDQGVTLELCPTSNWLTNAIKKMADHPFHRLMEAGVKTTINSDDPGIFNIDLVCEYEILKTHFNFSLKEFDRCNDFAASASFIDKKLKEKVWPRPIN